MKCEYCDNEIPAGATTCPSCGAASKAPQPAAPQQPAYPQQQVGAPIYPQQQVGAPIYPQQQVGAPIYPQQPYAQPQIYPPGVQKSRAVYAALGLFLGCFGIHNFYAGRIGFGVAQLLITLSLFWWCFPLFFIWIWVLLEICLVKTDSRGIPFA